MEGAVARIAILPNKETKSESEYGVLFERDKGDIFCFVKCLMSKFTRRTKGEALRQDLLLNDVYHNSVSVTCTYQLHQLKLE
jgi:hypothetical protein